MADARDERGPVSVPPTRKPLLGRRPNWKETIYVAAAIAGIVGTVLLIVGYGTDDDAAPATATQAAETTPPPPACTPGTSSTSLTVANDFRTGAWSRRTPVDGRFYSKHERPANGARWHDNCAVVAVRCVSAGEAYSFFNTIDGRGIRMRWNAWARLNDGSWLQMAAFAETTGMRDPNELGLRGCSA